MNKSPEQQLEDVLKIAKIKSKIEQLEKSKTTLKKEFEEKVKNVNKDILNVQKECPHIWKRYSDPSGGNDSFDCCLICGKEE